MTRYTFSNLDQWVRKTKKRTELVVKQATQDAIEQSSRTKPGVTRGGSVTRGFVPRADGFLAGSLQSSLAGGIAQKGEDSHVFVVAGMVAGDVAQFRWTAAYARKLHYAGWFWVDVTANNWPEIVKQATIRAKAQVNS